MTQSVSEALAELHKRLIHAKTFKDVKELCEINMDLLAIIEEQQRQLDLLLPKQPLD